MMAIILKENINKCGSKGEISNKKPQLGEKRTPGTVLALSDGAQFALPILKMRISDPYSFTNASHENNSFNIDYSNFAFHY